VTVGCACNGSARIRWTTNAPTTSNCVVYTDRTTAPFDEGWIFWEHPAECDYTTSDCVVGSPNAQQVCDPRTEARTQHEVLIPGLELVEQYAFRIRSSNAQAVPNEVRWGYVGEFYYLCSPVAPPPAPQPPQQPEPAMEKNRYLSFVPGSGSTSLRVKLVNSLLFDDNINGLYWWVQQPFNVSESSGSAGGSPSPTFKATYWGTDECVVYAANWEALLGTGVPVHVLSRRVIPSTTYEVQAIYAESDPSDETCYSTPLTITTSRWGDIVGYCPQGAPCTPPNGVVDFTDLSALVDELRNLPGAPIKSRADIAGELPIPPGLPDRKVDFVDYPREVDAFQGEPYPYARPTACP